jgi:uroporphyrinogen-III synthase
VTTRPLDARSVVVTRSGPRAAGLVSALEAAGATVLELALTEQAEPADGGVALRAAAGDLGTRAWVVLTSVNAVERLVAASRDRAALRAVRVAVVGPASADALRAAVGVEPDLVASVHSAAGLVDAFPQARPGDNRRVLFPAADRAPATVADGLAAKGWAVERVEAYRTVALPPPDPAHAARVAAADAIVFLAASSVEAYAAAAPSSAAAAPPLVVCIGATTAAAARAAGLAGVVQAPAASPEGLVAALAEHLGSPPGAGS